ncbi:MAG: hypothetical protein JXA22_01020 [Candidatus Thermoplasmatota archaeon]|nr:hypothetical protein [Candidatus Thermoplasmatota archaeon]
MRDDPMGPIISLVGDGLFPTRRSLEEFCLAVGLTLEKRPEVEATPPNNWDPSRYASWPMLELIAYQKDTGISGRSGMREFLYPYLVLGAKTVASKVGGSAGISALERLSCFFPV